MDTSADLNFDGYIDAYGWDGNGDGYLDSYVFDTNADGYFETVTLDPNADGVADAVGWDLDLDGYYETTWTAPIDTAALIMGSTVVGGEMRMDGTTGLLVTLAEITGEVVWGTPDSDHDGYHDGIDYAPSDPFRY